MTNMTKIMFQQDTLNIYYSMFSKTCSVNLRPCTTNTCIQCVPNCFYMYCDLENGKSYRVG